MEEKSTSTFPMVGDGSGTPLRGILQEAGVRADAAEIVFTGLDQEGEQVQYLFFLCN